VAEPVEKVTVVCLDNALAEKIGQADTGHALKGVVTSAKQPVYEHAPALYVHGPHWWEGPQAPPALRQPGAPGYGEPPKPEPFGRFSFDLPPQALNLSGAIKQGTILGLAFAEPISKPGTPSEKEPVYTAHFLFGLLPPGLLSEQDFRFAPQEPPDAQPESASEEVAPWIDPLLECFAEQIRVRIESPRLRPATPAVPPKPGETPRRCASRRILNRIFATERRERWKADAEPLVTNKIGKPLGVAVLVERGAILVLPECRDETAKVEIVRRLATDLWEPMQAWVRENAAKRKAAAEYQEPPPAPVPSQARTEADTGTPAEDSEAKPGVGTGGVKWEDALAELHEIHQRGDPYTSYDDFARRIGCSTATIKKAFDHSYELRKWRDAHHKEKPGSPRARSLNEVDLDNLADASGSDPLEGLTDDRVDAVMATLIDKAKPKERARLNSLSRAERYSLAEAYIQQQEDDPDYGDPDGMDDALLDRRP